jgi:hypothetical protein
MDGSQPAGISRVAVRLQPFWAQRPAMWFAQAEAQFSLAGISCERTKFQYIIAQLGQRYAAEVEDIITSPLAGPILQAENRAAETADPLKGAARSSDSHAPGDGRSQAITVPEAPQKPLAGLIPENRLDQPASRERAGHSRLPSGGRAGRRGLLTASSRRFPLPRSRALANQQTTSF